MKLDAALEFRGVTKTYSGAVPVTALREVNLRIEQGAFAAVMGPSGSGKSTLLQLGAGLDQPTAGEVRLAGVALAGRSNRELCELRRSRTGFIFQAYNLLQHLTAVENVEFICLVRGEPPRQTRQRALESLEKVGLPEKAHAFPAQLSGGQQQRVAVARAIVSKPSIIFADEPTANLDSHTALQLIELFGRLNRDEGATFFFSSHDMRLVERTRQVYEMRDGELTERVRA